MPSFQSIVPSIVEHKQIASGLTLNSTQFNLSRILGPAIAGVLLVSVGVQQGHGLRYSHDANGHDHTNLQMCSNE